MSASAPPITTVEAAPGYPVSFDVDYPDRELNRLTTFFRPLVALPVLMLLGLIVGGTYEADSSTARPSS